MVFIEFLIKGMLIGFSIALPVGPIAMLCIRNVLTFGILSGLYTGLGAAFADALYGAVAGFGVTAVSHFLAAHSVYLKIIGGIFLCYLGIKTFFSKGAISTSDRGGVLKPSAAFMTTFFLTLTNPMTVVSFIGIYAGLGLGDVSSNFSSACVVTVGVFLGSAIWWIVLSLVMGYFKEKIDPKNSLWLNPVSGSLIFVFGVLALISSTDAL